MVTFIDQFRDWLSNGHAHFFGMFLVGVWVIWAIKALTSRFYRPDAEPFWVSTSVIIPVLGEDPSLFRRALQHMTTGTCLPDEIIVVINGPRDPGLEAVCQEIGGPVRWLWRPAPGKRGALVAGIEQASGDVAVLVDSDTLWRVDTLEELMKPFKNPKVGGVTTHQRIYAPDRCVLTRFADWLEGIRTRYSMPSMSLFGQVGCLPGRTIAFRREILVDSIDAFLSEKFLGIRLEISDDRCFTNYVLKAGYKTVYQRTSVVYTDCPVTFRRFVKQQYRWARGSQYYTLRMFPWMVRRKPFLALVYTADTLIPFLLGGVVIDLLWHQRFGFSTMAYGDQWIPAEVVLIVLGAVVSIGARQLGHFIRKPKDLWFLPVFVLLLTLVITPVRIEGFIRMAYDEGWGTRGAGHVRGQAADLRQRIPYLSAIGLVTVFAVAGTIIEIPPGGPDAAWAYRSVLVYAVSIATGAILTVDGLMALVSLGARRARGRQEASPHPSLLVPAVETGGAEG